MAKNTYFTHGTRNEQILNGNLIDEYLKMFGLDIVYIPRKLIKKDTILNDEVISEFNDSFVMSGYLENFAGFDGNGDFLTKFGIQSSDEIKLVISRGMYEDFVAYSLTGAESIEVGSRPQEGDLIYLPLTSNYFEIKFVEHEEPFYQLGNTYVYKLKCELFEYEDEVIDTSIDIIDSQVQDDGYIATLQLVGIGITATASAGIATGGISELFLNNDGHGYLSTPIVSISTSPSGQTSDNATAVAFTTERAGVRSIRKNINNKFRRWICNTSINYDIWRWWCWSSCYLLC